MGAGSSEKPRTENHIRFAGQNWAEQQMIFSRIVFKIRILNDDNTRCGLRNAGAQSSALTLVDVVTKKLHARLILSHPLQNLPGSIARAIVDDNELLYRPLSQNQLCNLSHRG